MSQFDDETRLERLSDTRFGVLPPASWCIAGNLNGGYLMTLAAVALRELSPQHPDPLSVTLHYLRPGAGGTPCQLDVQLLRQGRTISTGRVTLAQDGQTCLEALAMLGDLGTAGNSAGSADHGAAMAPPDMPPPELCVARSGEAQGVFLPITSRLDIRLHPDDAVSGMSSQAQMRGWIRFRDGRECDSLALLLFADAFPPSVFGVLQKVGWVPTLEMTVHVRRRPVAGWIQAQFTTRDIAGGRLIEDGVLWDASGAVVAQVRQLALLPKTG